MVAIDVEYAHFLVNGQVKTAAAEVCVVKEDNSVLLESFICPGGFPQCTVRPVVFEVTVTDRIAAYAQGSARRHVHAGLVESNPKTSKLVAPFMTPDAALSMV